MVVGATSAPKKVRSGTVFLRDKLFAQEMNKQWKEGNLLPFAIWGGDALNVYWKKLEEAAEYRVEIYKNHSNEIYHLKDYIIPRNEGFLVVDHLLGDAFIIKVKAFDRGGKIIAEARAINGVGEPVDWRLN